MVEVRKFGRLGGTKRRERASNSSRHDSTSRTFSEDGFGILWRSAKVRGCTHFSTSPATNNLKKHSMIFVCTLLITFEGWRSSTNLYRTEFLLYVSIENLDAGTYMVTYQLKTLTTALFTVLMLKRRLSIVQWISLIILCGGVAIVQSGSDALLWLRNVQLAALSIPIGICMIAVSNGQDILEKGLLQDFDVTVWLVVCVRAFGGLVVAVVIKYADNILKAFATSFAIVVSSIAAIFLFAHYLTILFCVGAAFVIISVVLYSVFPYKAAPYSSTNQSLEKQTATKSPADATEGSITGIEIVESNIQPDIENNDDSAKAH